ncbi:MAG TPA: molybdopterin-binding protein, partial [Candidatus Xenobia bacterium]
MSSTAHKASAPKTVGVFVITVSDTRKPETDGSGDLLVRGFQAAGHHLVGRAIVPDEPLQVREKMLAVLGDEAVQAVVLNGGTGMSRR